MRVGAGRKKKDVQARVLSGWSEGRATRQQKSKDRAAATVLSALPVMAPPDDLPAAQDVVWRALAPHAAAQRTLTGEMALAFRDLCEAIVLKRRMLAQIEEDGLTFDAKTVEVQREGADVELRTESREIKKHPLLPEFRGLMQRVEQGMLRFRLSPLGKEVVAPAAPVDEWAEFDGSTH